MNTQHSYYVDAIKVYLSLNSFFQSAICDIKKIGIAAAL